MNIIFVLLRQFSFHCPHCRLESQSSFERYKIKHAGEVEQLKKLLAFLLSTSTSISSSCVTALLSENLACVSPSLHANVPTSSSCDTQTLNSATSDIKGNENTKKNDQYCFVWS